MTKLRWFAVMAALAMVAVESAAAELRVISGGAAKALLAPLADSFQRESGHSVSIVYAPMGELQAKLAAGEKFDMVVATTEVIPRLERDARVVPGSGRALLRVGVGVAVNERAPVPDISTPLALKQTLLAARSLVYVDPKTGTSGKHVAEVLEKLGIAETMKPRTTLLPGGYVVEPVGRGEIDIGLHQISEILPVKGVRLVGPLPGDLQKYTIYVAAPVPGTPVGAPVQAFIRHLTGTGARERLAALGFTAPE